MAGARLTVKAAGPKQAGFVRLVATATFEGQDYRALATAGFAPDTIAPTVEQPADFDAFWATGKDALAKLPVDAKLVPMPESSNGKVDCFHVSLQNVNADTTGASRFFGVLCEPKGEGPFPALLQVPGAGVRAYRGGRSQCRWVITRGSDTSKYAYYHPDKSWRNC